VRHPVGRCRSNCVENGDDLKNETEQIGSKITGPRKSALGKFRQQHHHNGDKKRGEELGSTGVEVT